MSVVYQAKWGRFVEWARTADVDVVAPPVTALADFFLVLFNEGLALSTIRGYRSAISETFTAEDVSSVGLNSVISALFRNFSIGRPVQPSRAPLWDLALVLNSLLVAPYEPLAAAYSSSFSRGRQFFLWLLHHPPHPHHLTV